MLILAGWNIKYITFTGKNPIWPLTYPICQSKIKEQRNLRVHEQKWSRLNHLKPGLAIENEELIIKGVSLAIKDMVPPVHTVLLTFKSWA